MWGTEAESVRYSESRDSSGPQTANFIGIVWLRAVAEYRSLPSDSGSASAACWRRLKGGPWMKLDWSVRISDSLPESGEGGKSRASEARNRHWRSWCCGKVTNYGDLQLSESLSTDRSVQSHFSTLDAVIDRSRCAFSFDSGAAVDPAISVGVDLFTLHSQWAGCLKWLFYISSFALWWQVRCFYSVLFYYLACRSVLMEGDGLLLHMALRQVASVRWSAAMLHFTAVNDQ